MYRERCHSNYDGNKEFEFICSTLYLNCLHMQSIKVCMQVKKRTPWSKELQEKTVFIYFVFYLYARVSISYWSIYIRFSPTA